MQRDDSLTRLRSSTRRRSSLGGGGGGGGWRQNSLTISALAQQDAFLASRAQETASAEPSSVQEPEYPPISYFKLFSYATQWEVLCVALGVIMASLNGLCIPVGVIIYGEFTAMLIDRTVPGLNSTETITLKYFGGGRLLALFTIGFLIATFGCRWTGLLVIFPRYNGTAAENRDALIEDSIAFGIGCTALSLVQFIIGVISVDLFNYTALRQIDRVKMSFLKCVLRQDITWYDTNTSMNFATRVSDDLEKYREGIGEKVAMLVYLVMSFITSVGISLAYGWELTLVILSCTPIIIGTTALVAKVQSSLTTRELSAYSIAGVIAEEVLSSIRTVIAFGGEQKELDRYTSRLDPAKKTGARKGLYSGVGSGVMWLIIYATYALSFWYGVNLILQDRGKADPEYTPAVLMIVFFSVLAGAQNVGLTSPHMEAITAARASAAALYAVINRVPEIDSASINGARPDLKGAIELSDVHFRYPARSDVKVLNGLTLRMERGDTVALVGSSGCGKSTVLQLVQRLYDPISGSVKADGHDLRDINVRHLRNHIAVVGQEPVLFAGSIRDNIRLSNPNCTDDDIEIAAKQAYCHNFIMKLPNGYNTSLGERGAQLSGGQKQRIAIARALVRRPTILLLDEATSALDSHSEAKVQRALDSASHGRTTIMVSHRLATVVNANRIIFIDKGQVVEQGTHDELLAAKGRYYQLVKDNEPALTENEDAPKRHKPKLTKLASIDSVQSLKSTSSESSEEGDEVEEKEENQEPPVSTWRILKMNMPEIHYMITGFVSAIVVGASFPAFAVLFGETYGVLESFDEEWVRSQTNWIALCFIIVGVVTGVGIFFQIYAFNVAGVQLTARLRAETFKCMMKQEMGWYDDATNGVGALTARLASDAAAVQGATGTRIGALVQAGATILIGICLSMYYTWRMTLVSLVSVPLVLGAVVLEGRILAGGLEAVRKASNKATTIATEAISNIRTVAGFCGEDGVMHRYTVASGEGRNASLNSVRYRGVVFSLGQTAPFAGYALSLYYGGVLVANKDLHYKEVIKVSEALIFGAWMMGQALAFAPNFGAALSAAGRTFQLLDRQILVESTRTPAVTGSYVAQGSIQYKSVSFTYPTRKEVQVLRGLTLDMERGKRIALVGASGCGKSTLIQLLQRLYDPDEGQVYLDSYSIQTDMTLSTLRKQLGIVSQEPVLFDKSIAENIAYGDNSREVPLDEIIKAAKEANIHGFIVTLPQGYQTRLGARAAQLSGGQKQRIAIARALVRNPRVLLLDEATSALDTHSEKVVQEALDKASAGRTCIIIAHRLATIQSADVICVIDKGVVAEKGTHQELLDLKGIYAKLWQLQVGFIADE